MAFRWFNRAVTIQFRRTTIDVNYGRSFVEQTGKNPFRITTAGVSMAVRWFNGAVTIQFRRTTIDVNYGRPFVEQTGNKSVSDNNSWCKYGIPLVQQGGNNSVSENDD